MSRCPGLNEIVICLPFSDYTHRHEITFCEATSFHVLGLEVTCTLTSGCNPSRT